MPPWAGLTGPAEWPRILLHSVGDFAPLPTLVAASPANQDCAGKSPRSNGPISAGEVEEAAVAVDGEAVAGEDGVAEDAVDPGAGIVEHDGDVAELGTTDPE